MENKQDIHPTLPIVIREKETTNYVSSEGYNISKGTIYISVPDFFTSIGILIALFCAILRVMWTTIQGQIKKSSDTNSRIFTVIEEREDKLRAEYTHRFDRLEDRVWDSKDKK